MKKIVIVFLFLIMMLTVSSCDTLNSLISKSSNSTVENTSSSEIVESSNTAVDSTSSSSITESTSSTVDSTVTTSSTVESISSSSIKESSTSLTETSSVTPTTSPSVVDKVEVTSYAGYGEGAYVEWKLFPQADNYNVYYQTKNADSYQKVDKELIRNNRVDVLGLANNTEYNIKIVPVASGVELLTKSNEIQVTTQALDRSGYAFFGLKAANDDTVGAYQKNGLPLANAKIIYVTNETKNTVSFGGQIGIAKILANASQFDTPLIVRIIGTITCAQYKNKDASSHLLYSYSNSSSEYKKFFSNELESDDVIDGITNRIIFGSSKKVNNAYYYDSDSFFNTIEVKQATNLTIEGVGKDAICSQWGMTLKKCIRTEVRNLTFNDYPEDACSFEGSNEDIKASYGLWLHHCTFNKGKNNWDLTLEQDKHDGDGSTDIKTVSNITISHCVYNYTHKTGLVGGSDEQKTCNVTFHHNFYNHCGSRLPLGRQANMHMYNNYYYSNSGNLSLRGNAYAFVENSYFEKCTNPVQVIIVKDKNYYPACKSFNNVFDGCSKTNNAVVVTDRTSRVTNGCLYGNAFDTDSKLFYYDSVNKQSIVANMLSAKEAKEYCIKYSGTLK